MAAAGLETLISDGATPLVRRRVAPNPSPMTERGTNTYVVGAAEMAVIDPGPDRPDHRDALLDALGASAPGWEGPRVAAILVTHSHLDHSAGARALAAATGAPIYGFGPHGAGQSELMRRLAGDIDIDIGGGEGADRGFAPDERLHDGAEVAAADGAWTLSALHTPGHLGNHLCFSLRDRTGRARALFSGDLVMGWATSLISPPDGDLGAFMASLARLAGRDEPIYFAGHGAPIQDPRRRVEELLAHRRAREAQILAALAEGAADVPALTDRIYADLDPRLRGMAARNVLAHLIDLWERGRVRAAGAGSMAGDLEPGVASEFDPDAPFALL